MTIRGFNLLTSIAVLQNYIILKFNTTVVVAVVFVVGYIIDVANSLLLLFILILLFMLLLLFLILSLLMGMVIVMTIHVFFVYYISGIAQRRDSSVGYVLGCQSRGPGFYPDQDL